MDEDIEKALDDCVIDNSKQNYPRKLSSTNFSPLRFVKKLNKHINHMMLRRTIFVSLMACSFIILTVINIFFIFNNSGNSGGSMFHHMTIILIAFSCFSLFEVIIVVICTKLYIPEVEKWRKNNPNIYDDEDSVNTYDLVTELLDNIKKEENEIIKEEENKEEKKDEIMTIIKLTAFYLFCTHSDKTDAGNSAKCIKYLLTGLNAYLTKYKSEILNKIGDYEKGSLRSIYKDYFANIINDNKDKVTSDNKEKLISGKDKQIEVISVDNLEKRRGPRTDPQNQIQKEDFKILNITKLIVHFISNKDALNFFIYYFLLSINDYLEYGNGEASDDSFVKKYLKLENGDDYDILTGLKELDNNSDQSLKNIDTKIKGIEEIRIEIGDKKYEVNKIAEYLEKEDKNPTFNSIKTLTLCCINFGEDMDENTLSLFFKGINLLLKPDNNINITRDLKIIAEALTLRTIFNDESDGKKSMPVISMPVMIEEVLVAIMRKMNEINDEIKLNETKEKEIPNNLTVANKVFGDVRTEVLRLKDQIIVDNYFNSKVDLSKNIFKPKFTWKCIPLYAATIILIPNLYLIGLIGVSSVKNGPKKEKHLMLKRIEINDKEKELIDRILFGLSIVTCKV
ncbi:8743_t:CDS:1 [Racocetra fulgida]|uniref:8743_t:CDS:1 n=1 Tax=Racocetra fulgida TaxID=60492 RepID=A0A9N8ZWY5_9GLOM|nr:8743_t:CDS:1 [Racocetra fulgida]